MGDVDSGIINSTKDTLGKVIKKPVLTEKLLKRPPFKFLHDIIINVIKSSGFMAGLYSPDDMNSENIRDKEGKASFLQKCIDVLEIVSGETIDVKVSKILAGLEADKTNILLQRLANCVLEGRDSKSAVEQVVSPAVKGKGGKTQTDDKDPSQSKSQSSQPKLPPGKTNSSTNPASSRKPSPASTGRRLLGSGDKGQIERKTSPLVTTTTTQEVDTKSQKGTKTNVRTQQQHQDVAKKKAQETKRSLESGSQASRKESKMRPPTTSVRSDEGSNPPPRPTTARAAPPRVPTKLPADELTAAIAVDDEQQRLASAKPSVKVISEKEIQDDDKMFVVEDAFESGESNLGKRDGFDVSNPDDVKGSLTKQLEETKEQFEGGSQLTNEAVPDIKVQDIEMLRQSLQSLSRSANPLGRIVDSLQEDIESMLTERRSWEEEFRTNSTKLLQERQSVDSEVEELRVQLLKMEQEVVDEKEKINVTRAGIERQEDKLRKTIAWVQKRQAVNRTS